MTRICIKRRFMEMKIVLSIFVCIIQLGESIYFTIQDKIWKALLYLLLLGIWISITRMAVKNWQLLKQIKIEENKRVTYTVKPASNGYAVYTITNLNPRKDDQPTEEK